RTDEQLRLVVRRPDTARERDERRREQPRCERPHGRPEYPGPSMAADRIESQLKRLSTGPGVYILRDTKGDVLYVGKAKSLRPRLRSYFQAGSIDTRQGIRHMASRVETIESIVTSSAVEALHIE